MSNPDMVNQPPHYACRKFETIEVLRDALTPEEFRGFLKGNALKYQLREGRKPGADQDVQKAEWYVKKLIEHDTEKRPGVSCELRGPVGRSPIDEKG